MATTAAEAATAGRPSAVRAFGLELDCDFSVPGLEPSAYGATCGAALPRVVVRQVSSDEIDEDWPAESAVRLSAERGEGPEADRTVDHDRLAGYRLFARYFGLARVSADGAAVVCAPPPIASWRWHRFLVGRALPLAALLHGYELLHASAVVIDGRALAILGPSGSGKSSIAAHLAHRGARLMTDDVLAIDAGGPRAIAHAGPGVVGLRDSEEHLARATEQRDLGEILGRADKAHVTLGRAEEPLALAALYVLEDDGGRAAVCEPSAPDPRALLASTLMHEVRTPERLTSQLDACSLLARTVPIFALGRGSQGPEAAAEVLERHARSGL